MRRAPGRELLREAAADGACEVDAEEALELCLEGLAEEGEEEVGAPAASCEAGRPACRLREEPLRDGPRELGLEATFREELVRDSNLELGFEGCNCHPAAGQS
jgi:hypothetical protein